MLQPRRNRNLPRKKIIEIEPVWVAVLGEATAAYMDRVDMSTRELSHLDPTVDKLAHIDGSRQSSILHYSCLYQHKHDVASQRDNSTH